MGSLHGYKFEKNSTGVKSLCVPIGNSAVAIGTPFRYMIVSGFLEFVSVTLVAILAQAGWAT